LEEIRVMGSIPDAANDLENIKITKTSTSPDTSSGQKK
jgi:hypothetical protein